jgi:hypothetical protein
MLRIVLVKVEYGRAFCPRSVEFGWAYTWFPCRGGKRSNEALVRGLKACVPRAIAKHVVYVGSIVKNIVMMVAFLHRTGTLSIQDT